MMHNALVLAAFLPLAGPEAGQHIAALPPATVIRLSEVAQNKILAKTDEAEKIPVLPVIRTTVTKPQAGSGWATPVVPVQHLAQNAPPRLAQSPPFKSADGANPVVPQTFAPIAEKPLAPQPAVQAVPVSQVSDPGMITPNISPNNTPSIRNQDAPRDPNVVLTNGILKIPKWNNVILAANYQAMLMKLQTERRDDQGNIVRDANGQPIIEPIREGMFVYEGQILGKFDDRELDIQLAIEQRKLDVAKAAKEKKIEVVYAARQVQTAVAALNMYKDANSRVDGAISNMEVIKAELEVSQAEANLELQKYTIDVERTAEVSVQEQSVEGMQVRIELRKLVAPISGMVVKIEKAEGEWLREGDPVLEIVQLDTLRVISRVDARYYTADMVDGKDVTVLMPMVNGRTEEFPGKVVFTDPRVTAGDEFEVFIEVQNRRVGRSWLLQPGRTITAKIHL